MKIVFIGTVKFSYTLLKKLFEMNANVVGVCTKTNSDFNSDFFDLAPICVEKAVPYKYIDDINSEDSIRWIDNKKPDVIFCFGFSYLIKKELLTLPPLGVIGYHPSELPKNRGRHPLIWPVVLGLKKSASTFFFMGVGADDGDILSQKYFSIEYDDTASILYDKVQNIASQQLKEFVVKLQENTYNRIPQDHSKANVWRKRGKSDGKIDFRMSSRAIYNLVRALSKPYVGAHIEILEKDVIIWKVEEVEIDLENIEPGKVIASEDDTITVKCYDNAIKIIEHEFEVLPKLGEYL